MPWVLLDDHYPEHPKAEAAGDEANWLNVCAWAYCARNLTDGHVPEARVAKLTNHKNPYRLAERLVEVELWEKVEDGYLVHDYLKYNRSREQVLAERDQKHSTKVAAGRAGGVASGKQRASKREANAKQNPSPSPVPIKSSNEDSPLPPEGVAAAPPRRSRVTEIDDAFVAALLDEFQDQFGSREAGQDVVNVALSYTKRSSYRDQQAWLRNWVRREAEQAARRRPNPLPANGRASFQVPRADARAWRDAADFD